MAALPETATVSPTVTAIEAAVEAAAERHDDMVVRASSIGKPCERHLWYRFRWAHEPEAFAPRMLRLFETGHIEEARMVGWLQAAGVHVDPVDPETGDQFEVVALDDHFKGHLDGIASGVIEAPKTPHLLECKTHNAKSFAQLVKHGVAVSKPEHVAQMQVYMHLKGLTRALYLAKNKDTDELWAERVEYDQAAAVALLAKAERIRDADHAPGRIAESPDAFACRFCSSAALCHLGHFARRNCRTCLHSSPGPGGTWSCARHKVDLDVEHQRAGCPNHLFLPDLVPGDQTDANEAEEWVDYAITRGDFSGSFWRDGAAGQAGRAA